MDDDGIPPGIGNKPPVDPPDISGGITAGINIGGDPIDDDGIPPGIGNEPPVDPPGMGKPFGIVEPGMLPKSPVGIDDGPPLIDIGSPNTEEDTEAEDIEDPELSEGLPKRVGDGASGAGKDMPF